MNRFGLLLAILLTWAGYLPYVPLFGQTATTQLNTAYDYLEQGNWAESAIAAQKAETMFRDSSNNSGWLQSKLIGANVVYEQTGDPFQALAVTKSALADPWLNLQKEEDYYRYCKVLIFNTWLAKQVGDFSQVKEDMEKAYGILKKYLPTKGHKIAEFIYADLGNVYVRLKEYKGARQIFEDNIQYSVSHPECAKYNDYGSLYFSLDSSDLPNALKIFQQGLDFNKNQPKDGKLPDAEVKLLLLNKAECLAQMGLFDEALQVNKAANDFKLSADDERYTRCMYGLYENYGIIYAGMGRSGKRAKFEQSIYWYKKAVQVASNPDDRAPSREIAGFQIAVGEVFLAWGKYPAALNAFHESMRVLVPSLGKNMSENPSMLSLSVEAMFIRSLHGKAQAFHALGQLDKALECYELIPVVEAKLRSTHAYESSSLLALKESRKFTHEAIDIAWQLFERTNGNPQYAERAFRLTEMARGMLLLQSLVQARQYLPGDIRDKDYKLRVKMAWLEHEIGSERENGPNANPLKIKAWEDQLFNLKLERQSLLAEFPSYNNPDSFYLQVLAARDVPKLLRTDQVMVNFFLTETASYIFSFDANGDFFWRKALLPAQFRAQTKQLAAYLWAGEETGREAFLHQAWQLDSLLLTPEQQRWPQQSSLIIVPDDVLMLVPFEVLLLRPAMLGSTWRDQPWLLTRYNLGYAYSATLLGAQHGISNAHVQAEIKPADVFGGFGPSYEKSSAYKLNSTRPMVKKVCNLLGGDAWLGDESSEEQFKNSAAKYRILLLAMHGISDNEHPELSRLLLGDPGPDSLINNNILYASELQIMRLQADLVVLSACHSGSGKLEQGEGVYSLARAFAAAGVPCAVMSLWLLHENTAPPLVEAFFNYLKQGKTKDEAIRMAKLDFLKNDANFEMIHPFFWAGLTASGDMRALDLKGNSGWKWQWWGVIVAVGLALVGFLFWRCRI